MPRNDTEALVEEEAGEDAAPRILDATSLPVSNVYLTPPPAPHDLNSYRWFILEPAVFLIFFARYLIGAVYQNQILYQTCVTIMKFNATECEPLLGIDRGSDADKKIEIVVQTYSANIMMTTSLLESIIPAFASLFLGPWSDKFGRRPILLTTFTGYLTGAIILIVITRITMSTNISPWWFLLSSVPSVLSGGTCALITGIYCYISDVAKERKRALRMVLNEASLCTGMMVGNVASGYIYAATNALTLFAIAGFLMTLALMFVFFFVPESLNPADIHTGSRLREFFRFDLVKDLVRTCFQRRPNYDRAIIWLTMVALTIAIFDMEGEGTVNYMFMQEQFNWTIKDFSLFNASRIVIQIVGSIVGMVVLRRVFKLSIVTMAMLSLACCVLESTVRATAVYWQEMYLGMTLGMMRGVMGPMCRAILSHVAPSTEVGKIFALTTSMESVSPLGAAPLYTTVYKATVESYPGAFNFISAGLYFVCYVLIAVIFGIQKSMGSSSTYQAIGS
ncbi:probable peptidoglycan muropeptide transporter SLC46 [Drosophila kikkawai]|uniref:Probable peptidoglycan muropeptide transporter SLC46 n=1 Tax=Drosophila kikkawai TaxID=30033 RepID=A0A6P4IFT5_DROKI|nr:proton-coupled folate transporter [Drosophila kikkawai]